MFKRTIAGIIAAGALSAGAAGIAQAQSAPDNNMQQISQEQRKDFSKKVSETWLYLQKEKQLDPKGETLSFINLQALAEKETAYDDKATNKETNGTGVFLLNQEQVAKELGKVADGDGDGLGDLTNTKDSIATVFKLVEKRTAELSKATNGELPGKPEMVDGASTKESVAKIQGHQLEAYLSGVAKAKDGEISEDAQKIVELGQEIHKATGGQN